MAYEPLEDLDQAYMSSIPWNDREFYFDDQSMPATRRELHADGVIRLYQLHLLIPLGSSHELVLNTRAFSLDGGKPPQSLLTSDQFIEWFHSRVAGGEDPFARKAYGLNEASIAYKDAHHHHWDMALGDFCLSGLDLSYGYYPEWELLRRLGIYSQVGGQLGFNLSQANPSMDLGVSASLVKVFAFKHRRELRLGLGASATRLKFLALGNGLEISNRTFLLGAEALLSYLHPVGKKGQLSLSATYSLESSYYKHSGFDYAVLSGERISSHWHYAISHLYRTTSANSLIVSFARGNVAFSLYLREDFSVDNAPDVQVGLGSRILL
jgi:hypothetical protein